MSFNEYPGMKQSLVYMQNNQKDFFDYVYTKISKDTRNRLVEKSIDSIDIIPAEYESIKVVPVFKKMNLENISIDMEIEKACKIIEESDFRCVYFVYPKNNQFNKHIQVKVPKLEEKFKNDYIIKLIPYSLKSKTKRSCSGNSNILCK